MLAVTRMFNIPIVVKQQAEKIVFKMELAFKKKRAKIHSLEGKVTKLEINAADDVSKKHEAVAVFSNWDI